MRKVLYILIAILIFTGCEFGDDYIELHDIHAALGEIVLTDTDGPVPLFSGVYIVDTDLVLPATGDYDVTFVWESSNQVVVADDGVVTRQASDVPVELTVTGTKGRYGQTRRFLIASPDFLIHLP